MDHYASLGIEQTASTDEIKKAYRKLALKYHPDKNDGDKSAEEMFKKISDAYSILSDPDKKRKYDERFTKTQFKQHGGFGFEDFVNNFGSNEFRRRSSENARKTQGRTHTPPPSSEHLNIYINEKLDLSDAMLGKKIELGFEREKINYTGKNGNLFSYTKEKEERDIAITIDLRKKYIAIKKEGRSWVLTARVSKLGNEDVIDRLNIWGEIEQYPLIGDLHVTLELVIPENILIEKNKIIQTVSIPLSRVIFRDEKIKVETIVNKKYEVDFNCPNSASNLKFTIPNEGILDELGGIGEYLVKFNVTLPQFDSLEEDDFNKLKSLILECENKS